MLITIFRATVTLLLPMIVETAVYRVIQKSSLAPKKTFLNIFAHGGPL